MIRRGRAAPALAIVFWGLLVFECRQGREDVVPARRLFGPVIGNHVMPAWSSARPAMTRPA